MATMKWMPLGLLLSLMMLISSCRSSVEITGAWKNPDAQPTTDYDQVMVTAMVRNESAKRAFENALERELEQANVKAAKGHVVFPAMFTEKFESDREQMLQKIRETENDAILSISLLDQDTEARYIPGRTVGPYQPMVAHRWYGSFWGYYNYYYPIVYDPGYYTTTRVYYLEANLYDAQSEKLIWSAQSQAYDPARLENFASEFAEKVVNELTAEGLLVTDPDRM